MFNWNRIPPLVRIPLKYGILSGLLSVTFLILFYFAGKHPLLIPPYFDSRILVMAILLFFALREVRDYFFGGILFFWQGMAGCLVFLASMALLGWIGIIVFSAIEPGFVSLYIEQGLSQIKRIPPEIIKQIGQEAVDEELQLLPNMTAALLAKKFTGQTFILGFFITIIISVISRRQPKP